MTVVFFWSAAARAVAPSSPMWFPAAVQHTRDPEPKSAPHDSKAKHAKGALARERAGPDAAGRASAARGERQRKGTLSPSPHIGRACAAGRGSGPKRPPTPPTPAATRARSRTSEGNRRDRRVLLERGRQSCRAVVADVAACGGAAHPRPRAQVSARFQGEARASGARTRTRGALRCWQGERSPRRATTAQRLSLPCAAGRGRCPKRPQPLHPPRPPEHARARSRSTFVTVVFSWSAAARAVAQSSPSQRYSFAAQLFAAAEQHTRDPEPKSAQHDSKPKHAQGLSLCLSLRIGRACSAGRGRGPKRPRPLHPPRPPEHARAPMSLTAVAPFS